MKYEKNLCRISAENQAKINLNRTLHLRFIYASSTVHLRSILKNDTLISLTKAGMHYIRICTVLRFRLGFKSRASSKLAIMIHCQKTTDSHSLRKTIGSQSQNK